MTNEERIFIVAIAVGATGAAYRLWLRGHAERAYARHQTLIDRLTQPRIMVAIIAIGILGPWAVSALF